MRALGYDPRLYVEENAQLKAVLDAIGSGCFSHQEPDRYRGMVNSLLTRDHYLLMADFGSYVKTQLEVDKLFGQEGAWAERALRNVAGMGIFSVDRTIGDYASHIWHTRGLSN